MNNSKKILGLLAFIGLSLVTVAQTYHADDKEGLRMFLRQPSATAGEINAERLGLQISDTINWKTDEAWIEKVPKLVWNDEMPKRLTRAGSGTEDGWFGKNLSGTLDANKWTKLQYLNCYNNRLTVLDASTNIDLEDLRCHNNQVTTLNLNASTNTVLTNLCCNNNNLLLSNLFAFSKILENNGADISNRQLGTQTLPTQTVFSEVELDFSSQNVFNGIYTEFTVTKDGSPAPIGDYTANNGKIIFHSLGKYAITMNNSAIISTPEYPAKVTVDVSVVECSISGNIWYPDQIPLNSGEVRLYLVQNNGPYILKDTTPVKSDGSYIFMNVDNGDYLVKVFPNISENLSPFYYGDTEYCDEASVVMIKNYLSVNSINIHIPFPLPPLPKGTSFIYGYVGEKSDGKGVDQPIHDEGVSLQVSQEGSWQTVSVILTDKEGYFDFRDVPAGVYRVILDIPCLDINGRSEIVITERDTVYLEFIIITTGISTITKEEKNIRVYPNPTTEELVVECPMCNMRHVISDIKIYDIMGRSIQPKIGQSEIEQSKIIINVSHLPTGMYFLRIAKKTVKFVKQ